MILNMNINHIFYITLVVENLGCVGAGYERRNTCPTQTVVMHVKTINLSNSSHTKETLINNTVVRDVKPTEW